MSYLSPLLQPTQSEYHIPRSYLKPKDNLIVVLEEEQGTNITGVEFLIVDRDTICSHISENYPPPVKFFSRKGSTVSAEDAKPGAYLTCPDHKEIVAVEFADYGNPWGACGTFFSGNCTTPVAKKVVEKYCLGKTSCTVPTAATAQLKKRMFCPGPDVKKTNHHSLIL